MISTTSAGAKMLERSVDRLKEVADLLRRIERKQGDIAKISPSSSAGEFAAGASEVAQLAAREIEAILTGEVTIASVARRHTALLRLI